MAAQEHNVSDKVSYRDSRRAAFRILQPGRRHALRRALSFLAVALAVWAVWHVTAGVLPPSQQAVLFLFLLAVGLWITEAVPAFAVGLLIMGYLVFALGTDLVLDEAWDVRPYLNTWSSPVIWLMLGGFFMAEGLSRTGLDRRLFALAIRPAGTRPERVLLAVMLTSGIASMFISNTSTTVLMIGAVLPLVRQLGREEPFSRALIVAIPLAASVGGMGTIIGSPPNAIAAGAAAEHGRTLDFVDWMALGAPAAIVLILAAWWFLSRRYPARVDAVSLEVDRLDEPELPGRRERWTVAALSAATVALWLTTPLHGIHVAAISLIPIVGLTMTQVLGAADVRGLPWDTLMLVAGGLSLGAAVTDTGLAARLAGWLAFLTVLDLDGDAVELHEQHCDGVADPAGVGGPDAGPRSRTVRDSRPQRVLRAAAAGLDPAQRGRLRHRRNPEPRPAPRRPADGPAGPGGDHRLGAAVRPLGVLNDHVGGPSGPTGQSRPCKEGLQA